jgi:hypothetical protein
MLAAFEARPRRAARFRASLPGKVGLIGRLMPMLAAIGTVGVLALPTAFGVVNERPQFSHGPDECTSQ